MSNLDKKRKKYGWDKRRIAMAAIAVVLALLMVIQVIMMAII